MKSLAIAATGMNAQQTNVEVIANNIANINTTSFKRARAEFTDLFYQMDRMQGVPNTAGASPIPEGANMGLGVRSAAVRKLHIQGALSQTGNTYDMAVNGGGTVAVPVTAPRAFEEFRGPLVGQRHRHRALKTRVNALNAPRPAKQK